MNNNTIRTVIIGTGAIGSYYGAKLSNGGAEVSAVCRSDYTVVKDTGIHITSPDGDIHFHPKHVIQSIDEYPDIPDYIILATKVLPEIDVTALLGRNIDPSTAIVLLQNGIETEKPVRAAYPDNEIISGLAFICVNRIKPGHTEHIDYGRLVIGTYPRGTTDKSRLLQELFTRGGVSCKNSEEVIIDRWKKLLWNAPFNPISVLGGGVNTVEMINSEPILNIVKNVMNEVAMLAERSGHPLPDEAIEKNISDTRVMKPYKTSMLLDYEGKKPMEIEAILGNAVRIAARLNVEVPHIQSLYGLLDMVDRKNRE